MFDGKELFLMNKNRVVATIAAKKGVVDYVYEIVSANEEEMPYGFSGVEKWVTNRMGSKHNVHLQKIMRDCGCDTVEGFIRVTHSASLNDTFWIKSSAEEVSWEDVSLYRNNFDEAISRLAFEGVGLYGIKFSTTLPESLKLKHPDFVTAGSFRKCWKKEADGIYLYKQGRSGASNVGLEPYCEALASEIAEIFCPEAIHYDVVKIHGKIASKCKLFTDEHFGYVPYSALRADISADSMLRYYAELGSEDAFRRMVVLDSLTFNTDRHLGNHGIIIDNDTLKPIRMAPAFDLNLALLPYVVEGEFQNIGDKLLSYSPCIGNDFTEVAKALLTSDIRSDLIGLKGFQFQFRGDDEFPEWRVKQLEELIQTHIEGILSKDKLRTEDVFVTQQVKEEDLNLRKRMELQDKEAFSLGQEVLKKGLAETYRVNHEENRVELILYVSKNEHEEIHIGMDSKDTWVEIDGIVMENQELALHHEGLMKKYMSICRIMDFEEKQIPEREPERV